MFAIKIGQEYHPEAFWDLRSAFKRVYELYGTGNNLAAITERFRIVRVTVDKEAGKVKDHEIYFDTLGLDYNPNPA